MAQKKQKVIVRGANGTERELVLVRVVGETAYVCHESRYLDAIQNPKAGIEVGFPVRDVREA